jgi:hypothetical protein
VRLPLVSYGNVARGVFAFGNLAIGFVAVGGSASIGVIAIGGNAVGVIAIGGNAIGPISLSAINSVGVIAWAGINAIGGWGEGLVNSLVAFPIGLVLATMMMFAGLMIFAKRAAPPDTELLLPSSTATLAELDTVGAGTHVVAATLIASDRSTEIILVEGDTRRVLAAEPGRFARDWFDRRGRIHIAITDEIEPDEKGYREAPERTRRFEITDVTLPPKQHLFTQENLVPMLGMAVMLGSIASFAALCLLRF